MSNNDEQNTPKAEEAAVLPEESGQVSNAQTPELQKGLEEAKQKADENWNLYLRTRADMENLKRRAQLDVENAYKYSIEKFAREILAVVDSLEHGLAAAAEQGDSGAALRDGMQLTFKMLLDTLEKFGIKRLEPVVGDAFNPACHEALSSQINSEVEPNKILFVAQKGFTLQERILRPARVIVAKAPVDASSNKVDQ